MKRVRLTENDLHNIVKKSVKRYLNEAENGGWYVDDFKPMVAYEFLLNHEGWEESAIDSAIVRYLMGANSPALAMALAYILRMNNCQDWKDEEMYGEV